MGQVGEVVIIYLSENLINGVDPSSCAKCMYAYGFRKKSGIYWQGLLHT